MMTVSPTQQNLPAASLARSLINPLTLSPPTSTDRTGGSSVSQNRQAVEVELSNAVTGTAFERGKALARLDAEFGRSQINTMLANWQSGVSQTSLSVANQSNPVANDNRLAQSGTTAPVRGSLEAYNEDLTYSAVPRGLNNYSGSVEINGAKFSVIAYPNDRVDAQGRRLWSLQIGNLNGDNGLRTRFAPPSQHIFTNDQVGASTFAPGSVGLNVMAAAIDRHGWGAEYKTQQFTFAGGNGEDVTVDLKTYPNNPNAIFGVGSWSNPYTYDRAGNRVDMKHGEQANVAEQLYYEGRIPAEDAWIAPARLKQEAGTPAILVVRLPLTQVRPIGSSPDKVYDFVSELKENGAIVVMDRGRNEQRVYLPNNQTAGVAWEQARSASGYEAPPLPGMSADFIKGINVVIDGNRLGGAMQIAQSALDILSAGRARAGRGRNSASREQPPLTHDVREAMQKPIGLKWASLTLFRDQARIRASQSGGRNGPSGPRGTNNGGPTGPRNPGNNDGVNGGSGGNRPRNPRAAGNPDPGDPLNNNPNNLRIFSTARGSGWGVSNLRSNDTFENPNRPIVHGNPELNQRYSTFLDTRLGSRITIYLQRPAGRQMIEDGTQSVVKPERLRMDSARQDNKEDGVWTRETVTRSVMVDPATGQTQNMSDTVTQNVSTNPVLKVTDLRILRSSGAFDATYLDSPELKNAGASVVPENRVANDIKVALPGGEVISVGKLAERQSQNSYRSFQIFSSEYGPGAVLPSGTRIFYPADSVNNAPAVTVTVP